jgi:hypothetical protein
VQANTSVVRTFGRRVAGVEVWHRYAQVHDFKGVWDAAGKVVKQKIRARLHGIALQNCRLFWESLPQK